MTVVYLVILVHLY